VVDTIIKLVRSLRPGADAHPLVNDYVTWAPGPRGSQNLMLAARARALLHGRAAPLTGDVIELAVPVLRHRMALNFKARADGMTIHALIKKVAQDL
jgi:MoxR-like ATPase